MKQFFKTSTIATSGDHGNDRDDKRIQKWVELRGGTFSRTVNKDVTHLICTKEHYKNKSATVKEALQIPTIHIVTFDWLEDCLNKNALKPTRDYLVGLTTEEQRARKEKKREVRKAHERKAAVAYSIYRDQTGFPYDVMLSRLDLRANANETYRIRLFESHGSPHLYACMAVHTIVGAPRGVNQIIAAKGSYFWTAMNNFTRFFRDKTMIPWHDRLSMNMDHNPLAFKYLKPQSPPYGLMIPSERSKPDVEIVQDQVDTPRAQ